MNLLIFGPPGAGKGTQSIHVAKKFDIRHISTGDLFRENIKNGTTLGKEAQGYMNRGELVPDELTIRMLESALNDNEKSGFILDGFPRTVAQAEALQRLLELRHQKLDKVLVLKVENDVIVKRLSGRRVCQKCGEVYHMSSRPTQVSGICDKCGSDQLTRRSDDEPAVILKRLETFWAQTAPVKAFYEKLGLVREINGDQQEQGVLASIESELAR